VDERRGIANDRRVRPAEVAREHDEALLGVVRLLHAQPDDRRAEDVAGIDERCMDTRCDLQLGAVVERLEQRQDGLRVVLGVERRVEVDDQFGRLRAQLSLGIRIRTVAGLDRRREMLPRP
jgi:hypothetical protein